MGKAREAVVAVYSVFSACVSAHAGEQPKLFPSPTFVEPRFLIRHAGEDLPPLMLLPDIATAAPLLPPRGTVPEELRGVPRRVAAKSDVVVSGGYEGAGDIATAAALAHREADASALWGAARGDRVRPYRDGGGGRVGYAYDRLNTQLAASHRFAPDSRLSLFGMRDAYHDGRIPHYGVDVTDMERGLATAVLDHAPGSGWFDRIEAGVSVATTAYDADNVSLRGKGALGLAYDADWIVSRGLVRGEFATGAFRNAVTVDAGLHRYLTVMDTRFPGAGRASWRLPEVEIAQTGVTVSSTVAPAPGDTLSAGLRLDAVQSRAGAAHAMPSVPGATATAFNLSPQTLWEAYYGPNRRNDPVDLNLSGRLRWQHAVGDDAIHLDVRRLVRTPDPGERFFGGSGPAALIQVGNPELSPEAHHRLEVGGTMKSARWSGHLSPTAAPGSFMLSGNVSHDHISDFITADRARGQAGILKADGGIVYRNVDAYLTGIGAEGRLNVAEGLGARLRLGWTRGGNLTDGRPLYQIPPLEGEAAVEYRRDLAVETSATVAAVMRFAGGQHRVDAFTATGSGQDTGGATGGFAVLDLVAGLAVGGRAVVSLGMTNVLDKRHHPHVNPVPQGPTTQPLAAPGRSLFLTTTVTF